MFIRYLFRPGAMALAVCAAFSALSHAQEQALNVAQTYYPSAGTVDIERTNTPLITRIRADYVYAQNISGRGITIAVLDTGINAAHHEFFEVVKLAQGFNALTGTADVTDRSGHGTHVAGIIGAARDGRGMFGVAYDATLLSVKVFPDNGTGSTTVLDRGLRYAIGKAAIVNMSVGAAGYYDPRAMQEALRAGMLIVASAGNDGAPHPTWPARFAKEAWANNQIIAVGAVDHANRITAFSNRAGDAAAWYLVAPGVGIASTYPNDRYVAMSGTSMATPAVSAAAALLMQRWPSLRADQIATILLVTATDLGAPGIDAVYGRGLLNVEKALQPIGALVTTTYNGKAINVLAGSVQPSSATSRLWQLAASGQLRVVGLDDFERDFSVDLGKTVSRPATMSLEQIFGSMDSRIDVAEQLLADGSTMMAAYEHRMHGPGFHPYRNTMRDNRLAAFSLVAAHGGVETAIGIGGHAVRYFGASGLQLPQGLSFSQVEALAHPYFALVPGASHAAVAQQIGSVKLKFGVLTSAFNRTIAAQDGYMPSGVQPQAEAGVFEMSKSFNDAALSVSLSQTRESHAYLGAYSSGALALANRASTSVVQFASALALGPNLALAGQAAYGITPRSNGTDSLITEITRARTNAFSLALVASDRMRPGDRLSLSVSQPMRAYTGRIVMDMLTGSSNAGRNRERLIFSMVPLGREMRAQLNYATPLADRSSFGLTLMVRREPNNIAHASTEKLIAVRYLKPF